MHENGETTLDVEAARDALEKFVMENDELLELEARIGRFNIFDALGVVNAEIRHSNFLGWLLDPAESHGAGDLFLKAILMDMLRQTPEGLRPEKVSPIDLDGAMISDVEIRREWKNIDLLIRCESPRLVVAIENKIRSGEHSGQLGKYKKIVREAFPDDPSMFVFLTREGDEPSDDDWTTYSYGDLKRVLERVRRTNEGAIGEDVDTFLDHYLHLIGSRLMDDQIIDDLCRKIYKNHRQAIDLLWDRVGAKELSLVPGIARAIEGFRPDVFIINQAKRRTAFLPEQVRQILPPISDATTLDSQSWIVWKIVVRPDNCVRLVCECWGTTDTNARQKVIDAIRSNAKMLGLTSAPRSRKTRRENSTVRLDVKTIYRWAEGDEPNDAGVQEIVRGEVGAILKRAPQVADVIADALKK